MVIGQVPRDGGAAAPTVDARLNSPSSEQARLAIRRTQQVRRERAPAGREA